MAARRNKKVSRGNSHVTVYPWPHPQTKKQKYRFGWRKSLDDPWKYKTCATKGEAETLADEVLRQIDTGFLVWSGLDKDTQRFLGEVEQLTTAPDREAVLAFLKSRHKSAEVKAAAQRFMDFKIGNAGEETRHLGNVQRDVMGMADHFTPRPLLDIHDAELLEWWTDRVTRRDKQGNKVLDEAGQPILLAKKTRNEVRGNLVSFWNWCITDRIHPKDTTPADKLPLVKVPKANKRIATTEELLKELALVEEEFRPAIVLGCFFGTRPEEVAPAQKEGMSKKDKRGLHCEEIDWRFRCIRLPDEVSKVENGARVIPFFDGAEEWLEWAGLRDGMTGPVCKRNMSEAGETVRLGVLVFGEEEGWPQDHLRHTYGSNRDAVLRNRATLAIEMGTSEGMLKKHYVKPRVPEEGEAYFALRPKDLEAFRFVPMKRSGNSRKQKTGLMAG